MTTNPIGWITFISLLGVAACQVAIPTQTTNCRICPSECISVPKADGSCPVCICNGLALPDCPSTPADSCPAGCTIQQNTDGCMECSCTREQPVVCPSLPSCPEECLQILGEDGCPRCTCDAPPRMCPAITCPDQCTEEIGEDGCISCRCQRPQVCPEVHPCLRGCVEMDQESGCFACNCTLAGEEVTDPVGGESFGIGPFGPVNPSNRRQPGINSFNRQQLRCRSARLRCPPGCRVVVAAHGCRECICGDDAFLCPGVPQCLQMCLFMSPEDRCCRCNCTEATTNSTNGLRITLIRVPSFNNFRPFGQFGPFTPFGSFGIFRSPSGRPGRGRPGSPLRPGRPGRPGTPRIPGNNCPEISTCDPGCEMRMDSDGCPLCVCPGDLCPRIRCPPRCVQQIGLNGCPECDCGGRPNVEPESFNPDAEPVNPLAPAPPAPPFEQVPPVEPAPPVDQAPPVESVPPVDQVPPVEPVQPANPVQPVEPIPSINPVQPEDPLPPIEPMDSINPINPLEQDIPETLVPVNPNDATIPENPMIPGAVPDESRIPLNPVDPAMTEDSVVDEPESLFESTLRNAQTDINSQDGSNRNVVIVVDPSESQDSNMNVNEPEIRP